LHRSHQVTAHFDEVSRYRLLSEAEWEYAARGHTITPFYWGAKASHDSANYGAEIKCPPCGPLVQGKDRWNYTSPVGSFGPNPFGLYDMSGNVWEWVEDCWHDTYAGAPSDGTAWTQGDCKFRVDRGGSWVDNQQILRLAYRDMDSTGDHDYYSGFRVARSLH
jgi:formylglycine-generating enzyme required for sulfatase activity